MFFSLTVVSTLTCANSFGERRDALLAHRQWDRFFQQDRELSAPTRPRRLTSAVECSGSSCCIVVKPKNYCQYGFSTQRATRDDRLVRFAASRQY
jgi:hypothetical protein